jgi:hypothetical protein
MSAPLLARLEARGIRLRRVGDRLGVTFPRGIEPPGALAYIREHKAALLALLPDDSNDDLPTDPPPTPVELELQAAIRAVGGAGRFEAHPTARCAVHACPQRRSPHDGRFRCVACSAPWVWLRKTGRAA